MLPTLLRLTIPLLALSTLLPGRTEERPVMFERAHSPRIANYDIDVRFIPEERRITGSEVLRWRNTSGRPVSELRFHLYLNAFSGPETTFLTELGEISPRLRDNWSSCQITGLRDGEQTIPLSNMSYIQPDDDNPADRTVASLSLTTPVAAGETIELAIQFETILPPLLERAGYIDDFFMVTQWFPKIGVLTDSGWVCHQYHANSEFFADFGVYHVKLRLPAEYQVGATGITHQSVLSKTGDNIHQFYAEDVHDFAWAAGRNLQVVERKTEDLTIRLLYNPAHPDFPERILHAVENGIAFFQDAFGDYPYPQITVIDCPVFNGVMEYPMLFSTGYFDGHDFSGASATTVPTNNRYMERLTLHELAHMWWYGMSANNEATEAWLDESLTDYSTTLAFEHIYGENIWELENGDTLRVRDFGKHRYLANPSDGVILAPSWAHDTWQKYYVVSYIKPKLLLQTLRTWLTPARWDPVMQAFFQQSKFRHPTTSEFVATVNRVTGQDWSMFLDQFLRSTDALDFSIKAVTDQSARIENLGKLGFPAVLQFDFEKGPPVRAIWGGMNRETQLNFPGRKITAIQIDPEAVIEFELSRDNNSWSRGSE